MHTLIQHMRGATATDETPAIHDLRLVPKHDLVLPDDLRHVHSGSGARRRKSAPQCEEPVRVEAARSHITHKRDETDDQKHHEAANENHALPDLDSHGGAHTHTPLGFDAPALWTNWADMP